MPVCVFAWFYGTQCHFGVIDTVFTGLLIIVWAVLYMDKGTRTDVAIKSKPRIYICLKASYGTVPILTAPL